MKFMSRRKSTLCSQVRNFSKRTTIIGSIASFLVSPEWAIEKSSTTFLSSTVSRKTWSWWCWALVSTRYSSHRWPRSSIEQIVLTNPQSLLPVDYQFHQSPTAQTHRSKKRKRCRVKHVIHTQWSKNSLARPPTYQKRQSNAILRLANWVSIRWWWLKYWATYSKFWHRHTFRRLHDLVWRPGSLRLPEQQG